MCGLLVPYMTDLIFQDKSNRKRLWASFGHYEYNPLYIFYMKKMTLKLLGVWPGRLTQIICYGFRA